MTLPALSARERTALDFVGARLRETGVSPSYDDIAEALSLRSKSGVSRVVHQLVEKGYLTPPRRGRRSMAITPQGGAYVVHLPEDLDIRLRQFAGILLKTPDQVITDALRLYLGARVV